jgi:hypothetical protein
MDSELADLNKGATLLKEGRVLDALKYYAVLLQEGDGRADLYRNASLALINAVSANVHLDAWNASERKRFLTALILQEGCSETPPILHHLLASHSSSGSHQITERVSTILIPVLQELLQVGAVEKNLVLLILLLRESIDGIISQDQISALHLTWVDKFAFGDLAIPYNCMFDQRVSWRNRDDIVLKLLGGAANDELFDRFSLYHLLFFEWLSHRDIASFAGRNWFEKMMARLDGPALDINLSAAKSLFVRYCSGDRTKEAAAKELSGFDRELVHTAADAASARNRLQMSISGRVSESLGTRLFNNRLWQGALAARSLARSRFPLVVGSKRKIRVAVCISGQLRGYQRAWESWKTTLLKDIEYDLFVHSWTAVGRSGAEPFRQELPFEGPRFADAYRELCLQSGFEDFRGRYPSLFAKLANTGRVTEQEIAEFYGTPNVRLDDDGQPPFAQLSNQEKMHNKIEQCFDMVMASGREYDLIVRLRPDKPIKYLGYRWNDLREICHRSPRLFADHGAGVHYTNPMIGDQFAVAALQPMQIYASTWSSYPQIGANGLLNCTGSFVGHVSLAQMCWIHGIKVEKAPIRFDQLQDPARLSARATLESLECDAVGRMDRMDRLLLAAAKADSKTI